MIRIVRWTEIVGRDFLEMFTKIEKMIVSQQKDGIPTDMIMKNLRNNKNIGEDNVERWEEKRRQIRFCGYEVENKLSYPTGWYEPTIAGNELKFMLKTRVPEPLMDYITLDAFKADKEVLDKEDEKYEANRTRVYKVIKVTTGMVGNF
jgi:hypothetical protein